MVEVTLPYEFVGGSKAIANQVNANFEAISRGFRKHVSCLKLRTGRLR